MTFDFSECATLKEAVLLVEEQTGWTGRKLAAIGGFPQGIWSNAKQGARITDAYKPRLMAAFGIPADLFPGKPAEEKPIPEDDGAWIPEIRERNRRNLDIETGRA